MLNRRNVIAAFAAAAMTLPALGMSAASASAQEMVDASLRLKWLTQAQFAGFYVALEKGYYKDEGINVAINPGGPNLLTENLVATGADTFGLSGGSDSVFAARDKGLPVVCIGVAHQQTPFVFVSHKDGAVQSVADFKGKKITTWFTGATMCLRPCFRKPASIRSRPISSRSRSPSPPSSTSRSMS